MGPTSVSPDRSIPSLTVSQEADRLAALENLDILDTPQEEGFDRIVRLIQSIFDVPTAVVSLMDGHRQWHKACVGVGSVEVERKDAFCRTTVAIGKLFVINDTRLDPLWSSNPHVVQDGGIRFYAGAPLRTVDGQTIGTVCAMGPEPRAFDEREARILTELAQLTMDQIELRKQAETDLLTGLRSRRAFREQASRAVSLARRHGHPLSCATIDIDHFKHVNDTHGHATGDMVLAEVAAACRSALRSSDILGRLGGEEFAVILPHTAPSQALKVAEKLRQDIRCRSVALGNVVVQVTASIGLASLDAETHDLDALLALADKALYEAKGAGRDRCISAQRHNAPVRRRVLKGGKIVSNGRLSTTDCTIRSLDDEGAGIEVWSAHDLPDTFTLVISPEGLARQCKVVARSEKRLEVEFLKAAAMAS